MGKNILLEALRNNDTKKSHLFESNGTFISYPTGFPALDYSMGFNVNVYDEAGELEKSYPAIGITAGSIVTVIGKTHVGKTTAAIQWAAAMIRNFDNGFCLHYDLEGGTNLTRVSIVSRIPIAEINNKWILRQTGSSIEEIKATIASLYREKTQNPDKYLYDTGKLDEFGETIKAYQPTAIIIDSVPSMTSYINENTKDGLQSLEGVSSQTDRMRLTAEIGRFMQESMQMLKAANITMFLINHIKNKPPMGTPQQAELRCLRQDETLPAGKALQYYTNTMIRLTAIGSEKYTEETDGFNGFGVNALFVKNRTNTDGTIVPLVFDKVKGYDSLRSSISLAKEMGILNGNRNGYYLGDHKDKKFKAITVHEDFNNDRELYKILYGYIVPELEKSLSSVKPEELINPDEELDY